MYACGNKEAEMENNGATAPAENTILKPDPDGMIRWVYEQPMMKSFFLLFEVWRVLGLAGCIVIVIDLAAALISGNGFAGAWNSVLVIIGVMFILFLLSIPAYWIVTRANNGKYTVLFEMNEEGVNHTQIKTDKAKALDALSALAGQAAGKPSLSAPGVLSAAGGSLYSKFIDVRAVKAEPNNHLIRLDGKLIRNQVYADDTMFDEVLRYISAHCPNAVIR